MKSTDIPIDEDAFDIAIVGMSGRFPGANNVHRFWENLCSGVESISFFSDEELLESGVDAAMLSDPNYVRAAGVLDDPSLFDASFFDYSPRDARFMDPQHRLFLECAWEALEDAGYDAERYAGLIGVYAGANINTYVFFSGLLSHWSSDSLSVLIGNDKDFLTTRVSYKLNLRGPSVTVQTACSTSLVAVHMACQSLLNQECDMALAGGATVRVPHRAGYLYYEGGIQSPDGHCRAFDARAQGTTFGSGVGIVVLKRLADAIADGDHIYALIKGSAMNNDGSLKAGYTAPSVDGQCEVVVEAQAHAGVEADTIRYIEAHGTGTTLGDPIEVVALTRAFRMHTDKKGFCAIGSVKTNIGHLDAAAGVTGLIKTVLALKHKLIPPSLHFEEANPEIDFENSPFYVNSTLSEWNPYGYPRRAGVSSLGIGGTNAHVILEESPPAEASGRSRRWQLLLLSARTSSALDMTTSNLVEHLKHNPESNLADVAYTLQVGRKAFNHRRIVVCQDAADAISALEPIDPKRTITSTQAPTDRDIVYLFSGQGSQYANMGLGLYTTEKAFRDQVDRCSEILEPHLSRDLRQILYPEDADLDKAEQMLRQTAFTQPALFVIEYALAQLWIEWGLGPSAMVGHSIGEYVAACLADVFSLEDALSLVATRGRLMQELPSGSMLAVPLTEERMRQYLDGRVCLAVVNNPAMCVVSGEHEAVRQLEAQLSGEGVESRYLHTSHAFHSRMMEPILDPFKVEVAKARPKAPQIPLVSNVTGTWISPDEATDPDYWARHLRHTVRFSDCLHQVCAEPNRVLLEVGPGRTLATLAKRHPDKAEELVVLSSARHPKEASSDQAFILDTLGRLWLSGVQPDWSRFYADESRNRARLPTYPFERKRYWLGSGTVVGAGISTRSCLPIETEREPVSGVYSAQEGTGTHDGAPRNEMERALVEMWAGLLGVENLTIYDNFFEAGGSSLLATRLFTQIGNEFGERLPLATIFEAPTIEELASLLDREVSPDSHSSLVRIQGGQSRPPLFCVPGNLGNVFTDLRFLSQHVGADQPFYGLQDGLGHPSRIELLAAHYVEDIRQMQPDGPYLLAGICSGGVVVFEMAQQLVDQGQSVALLALIEPAILSIPGAHTYGDLFAEIWERFTARVGDDASSVSRLSPSETMMYVRLRRKLIANIWALKRYHPRAYPGRFALFLTRESILNSTRPRWSELVTGEASIHEIPGTHRSITGDNAQIEEGQMEVLAERIRECLDDALMEAR